MLFKARSILKMSPYRVILLVFVIEIVASAQSARAPRLPAPPDRRPENFYAIKKRKDAQFEALRRERGERFLYEEEGTGYVAYQEWVRFWEQRVYLDGDLLRAHRQITQIKKGAIELLGTQQSGSCNGWTELGPFDMPLGTSQQRGIGRVMWIAFDPANANNIFTGSPKGGLFYSTDAGASWQSGGTDFLLPNIGASHVAVDPTDGNRWFLATGDGDSLNDNGWNVSPRRLPHK